MKSSFENLDDMCYCLDSYKHSNTPSCLYEFPDLNPEIDSIIKTCRTRTIRVKIISVEGIQEECCGDNCIIALNKNDYSVQYNSH